MIRNIPFRRDALGRRDDGLYDVKVLRVEPVSRLWIDLVRSWQLIKAATFTESISTTSAFRTIHDEKSNDIDLCNWEWRRSIDSLAEPFVTSHSQFLIVFEKAYQCGWFDGGEVMKSLSLKLTPRRFVPAILTFMNEIITSLSTKELASLAIKPSLVPISVDYEGHDDILDQVTEYAFWTLDISTLAHLTPGPSVWNAGTPSYEKWRLYDL